jgi:hypothetical protein
MGPLIVGVKNVKFERPEGALSGILRARWFILRVHLCCSMALCNGSNVGHGILSGSRHLSNARASSR